MRRVWNVIRNLAVVVLCALLLTTCLFRGCGSSTTPAIADQRIAELADKLKKSEDARKAAVEKAVEEAIKKISAEPQQQATAQPQAPQMPQFPLQPALPSAAQQQREIQPQQEPSRAAELDNGLLEPEERSNQMADAQQQRDDLVEEISAIKNSILNKRQNIRICLRIAGETASNCARRQAESDLNMERVALSQLQAKLLRKTSELTSLLAKWSAKKD